MIRLIQGSESAQYPAEIQEMYKLRAKVFHDRLKWDVIVRDGLEIDEFDEVNPLYLVSIADSGKVCGTVRLLPTTGPNMLADVFSELLPEGEAVNSPTVWESSRFSVDHEKLSERSDNLINYTTAELLSGMTEVGMMAGLSYIVSVVDIHMERILKRANCHCERIGTPKKIGKVTTVAGLWEIGDELLSNLHEASGIRGSVLEQKDAMRLGLVA